MEDRSFYIVGKDITRAIGYHFIENRVYRIDFLYLLDGLKNVINTYEYKNYTVYQTGISNYLKQSPVYLSLECLLYQKNIEKISGTIINISFHSHKDFEQEWLSDGKLDKAIYLFFLRDSIELKYSRQKERSIRQSFYLRNAIVYQKRFKRTVRYEIVHLLYYNRFSSFSVDEYKLWFIWTKILYSNKKDFIPDIMPYLILGEYTLLREIWFYLKNKKGITNNIDSILSFDNINVKINEPDWNSVEVIDDVFYKMNTFLVNKKSEIEQLFLTDKINERYRKTGYLVSMKNDVITKLGKDIAKYKLLKKEYTIDFYINFDYVIVDVRLYSKKEEKYD